jgi:UDP:flavonoid glycosyltransferase YjiC (YdhE family)
LFNRFVDNAPDRRPCDNCVVRVLFTSSPGWGHIHPMVGLARAFLDRGDRVLWVTGADACARLEREGIETSPAGLSERDGMSELSRQFPEIQSMPPADRPDYMFPRLFGTVRAASMLVDLMPAAKAFAPTLVVCDAAEFAGPIVAAAHGVPNVTHSFGALLFENASPRQATKSLLCGRLRASSHDRTEGTTTTCTSTSTRPACRAQSALTSLRRNTCARRLSPPVATNYSPTG